MQHYRAVFGIPHGSGFCFSPLLGSLLMAFLSSEMLIIRESLKVSAGSGLHGQSCVEDL